MTQSSKYLNGKLLCKQAGKFFKEKLTLSLGTRFDATDYSSSTSNMLDQFSPRFSASYDLTSKWFLNFNTGRFYQLPAYTTLGYRNSDGELENKENNLKYISAEHIVGGIAWYPQSDAKITLESFYKNYSDYPFSLEDSISLANKGADFGTVGGVPAESSSEGRAYGLELLARDQDIFGFNALLSYTLVRSEFKAKSGEYRPSSWDNIHLLNITLRRGLKGNWDIGAKFRFVGGSPYTPWNIEKSAIKPAWNTAAVESLIMTASTQNVSPLFINLIYA